MFTFRSTGFISFWRFYLFFTLALLVAAPSTISAQAQRFTASGYVREEDSGEALIGATIQALEAKTGSASNEYGFFSLRLPAGRYTFVVHFQGYAADTQKVDLTTKDAALNFELKSSVVAMKEVVIEDKKGDENVAKNEMSVNRLDMQQVKTMPALFGEVDIIRSIQLLPGVKTAGDGSSSFFVRGGNYDQNLILLDEATVYNASHLLGFFSVFNSDAIKDATLMKGAMPSSYGGRLSSVLTIRMNEGNNKKFHVQGGIGLLSSRLMVEGPIKKDKGSFIVTGRRTYADLFLKLQSDPTIKNNTLYFYDFNAKANYTINENNRIYLSGYFGRDVFGLGDEFSTDWGNSTGTLRWNHLFSKRLFSNTTLIFSDFAYQFGVNQGGVKFNYSTGIREYSLKQDLDYFLNPQNHLKFGFQLTYQRFNSGEVTPKGDDSGVLPFKIPNRFSTNIALYIGNEQKISNRLTIEYGYRHVIFWQLGSGTTYKYEYPDQYTVKVTDSTVYTSGKVMATYHSFEPRFAGRFQVDEKSSVKASYTRTGQFIQVASNASAGLPTDLWLPSTATIKPQFADQIALGYFRNFKNNMFEASVEVYHKWLHNQIDLKNNANVFINKYQEGELVFGSGRTYGVELFFKKALGKTTGWVSYTLAWSKRTFPAIDDGREFYARNDRRHDIAIVLSQQIGKRWTIAGEWVYWTGLAFSAPSAKYTIDGQIAGVYTGRNEYRMPDYHRMDISATLAGKPNKKFKSGWNFSIFNVYARANPWAVRNQTSDDGSKQQAIMIYLFTIVPSVTWNFEF